MKNILTIIKKEFARFFKDRRMVLTILLPGILIFALYSLLGNVFSKMAEGDKDYTPIVYVFNMPQDEDLNTAFGAFRLSEKELTTEEAKEEVKSGNLDLLIIFPENFEFNGNVCVFFNSSNDNSTQAYYTAVGILEYFQKTSFTINADQSDFDLAEEKDTAGKLLSMLIPMLMFSLLASAGVAVAPESIAGEKERGTMATMLITPIKRSEIALGKIISLTCFALLSGISSFLGVAFSLPKLMGGMVGAGVISSYPVSSYFMLFGLIISIVLVIISAFSVVSAFAKSVKESGSMIAPFMILIILLGMVSMFISGTPSLGLYAIPLLGSGLAMSQIMAFTASPLGVALAIISNLVLTAVLVVVLAFMFKSEKIMFKK